MVADIHQVRRRHPGAHRRSWSAAALLLLGVLLLLPLPGALAFHDEDNQDDFVKPVTKNPGKNAPIKVRSDRLTHYRDTGIAVASGDVIIDFGPYKLIADKVIYDPRSDKLTAEGDVYFREPNGNVVRAKKVQLSDRFRKGFVDYLRIMFTNQAWLTADRGVRRDGNVQVFDNVVYSRCNDCVDKDNDPLWQIRSKRARHVQDEGTIYHEDMTFEIFGTPVLWLPEFSHADPTVNKRSGFLTPSYQSSGVYGFGMEIPYFWNLAPNYDVTLRPVVTTRQGVLGQADWRHRLSDGSYKVDLAGIYQLDTDIRPPGDTRWRGSVRTEGHFDVSRNWQWGWDVTATSDDTFMRRYDIDDRTDLVSQVYVDGIQDRNYFTAKGYHFRGLLESDDNSTAAQALPFIRHSYTYADPILGGELGFDTRIFNLIRDLGADSARVSTDVHWQRRMVNSYGHVVTPFVGVRGDVYVVDNVPDVTVPGGFRDSETIGRVLPRAGLDFRWPFVNQTNGVQHVFEPVGQLIAAADESDTDGLPNDDSVQFEFDTTNLFLSSKFTGIDRYEGGTRANVGFNYTMLFDTGAFVRTSFGETFHIAGENSFDTALGTGLETNRSDFVASVALQPIESLMFTSLIRFDERTLDVQRHDISVQAHVGPFDVAATYTDIEASALEPTPGFGRAPQEQVTAFATLALDETWDVFGGLRYDIETDQQIKNIIGLRFNCDCFTAEIIYSENFTSDRDAVADQSLTFNVVFKTLGGARVGTNLD
ncbi:MAG: LPS-assembly protein LptD [Hyphomicrobiales bacterium]